MTEAKTEAEMTEQIEERKANTPRGAAKRTALVTAMELKNYEYDWARIREVAEEGAILVRPDKHIGWRSMGLPADPERSLREAMSSLLGRERKA